MCCFSRPVKSVTGTNIFARPAEGHQQFLVYSMTLKASEALAMVLPLPVKSGSGEKAVTFFNLKDYPDFFRDLANGFEIPNRSLSDRFAGRTLAGHALEVFQVGDFEASYVPTVGDFSRLDERFRLPPRTWEALPAYRNYGFAVFKLKPGAATIHPMAFSFPRADAASLFFPTVHIHDGGVHSKAKFDHALFCQTGPEQELDLLGWEESRRPANLVMKMDKTKRLILGDRHFYRKKLKGNLPNQDTRVAGV